MKNNKAFTLIELLVVISIIGLLASVILVSLNSARSKARDAKRIGDINQLAKALELYFDKHDTYPTVAAGGQGCWAIWQSGNVINGSGVQFLQPLVTDGIIAKAPLENYFKMGDGSAVFPGFTLGDWLACGYRYLYPVDFTSQCGPGWANVAALYTWLENPPPNNNGRSPACLQGYWGEGDPANNDYLILLRSQ